MSLYFDTSALVPAYVPESRTEKATALLAQAETPHVSRLTEVEFHSALALKLRSGQMRRKDAEHVAKVFSGHLASGIYARLQIPGEVFDLSLSYLRRFHHQPADARRAAPRVLRPLSPRPPDGGQGNGQERPAP